MGKILGIGNALIDALYKVGNDQIIEELHLMKGGMQLIDIEQYKNFSSVVSHLPGELRTGGSAGNATLCFAKLGKNAAFIGKLGRDDKAALFSDERRRQGITPIELFCDLPTGVATTFITPDGQRTFATYLGAAATMTAEELRQEWFEGYDFLFIEGYLVQNHALIETAVDMAHAAGAKVCLDLASYNIIREDHEFFTHLLTKTDIVFANEEESLAMTGLAPDAALEALAQVCEIAVVKVGAKGATAMRGSEKAAVPAVKVAEVVDTTAAGDFFAGGFLAALSDGASLTEALTLGARCSSEVIQVIGTKLDEAAWTRLRTK